MGEHGASPVTYEWRGAFADADLSALHAGAFAYEADGSHDWSDQVRRHSLGWVCARWGGDLVGFVNVAWDGALHAFILDTVVSAHVGRQGIGTRLVSVATEQARAAGCVWLHVDFDEHLSDFYMRACGFRPTPAGLIALQDS